MLENETTTPIQQEPASGISRRKMLLGMGAAASVAYAGSAVSAMHEGGQDHSKHKHDHSKHSAQLPDVLAAANNCVDKGQRCIAHCLVSFQEGDLKLADCASKVHEMDAICRAFTYLLAANSQYSKAYAEVCAKVCQDCENECRKHEEHIECKACAEACSDLVDQIKLRLS